MGIPVNAPATTSTDLINKGYPDTNAVFSTSIRTIVSLTQTAYDALGTKDANTLYVII